MPQTTPPFAPSPHLPQRRTPPASLLLLTVVTIVTTGCTPSRPSGPPPPPNTPAFFTHDAQPIFREECIRCHGNLNHKGGLRLDSRAAILLGGKSGPILIPGHPEQSLLVTLIRHQNPTPHPGPMPPKGTLSEADIATITRWIQAGALIPKDSEQ